MASQRSTSAPPSSFSGLSNEPTGRRRSGRLPDGSPTSPPGAIIVYTDGSVNGQRTASGIGMFFGHNHPLTSGEPLRGPIHDSALAEFMAALTALQRLRDWNGYRGEPVVIRADYLGLIEGINYPSGPFQRELEQINDLARRFPNGVEWQHIYAHNGNAGNESADGLAYAAMRSQRTERDSVRLEQVARERSRSTSMMRARSRSPYAQRRRSLHRGTGHRSFSANELPPIREPISVESERRGRERILRPGQQSTNALLSARSPNFPTANRGFMETPRATAAANRSAALFRDPLRSEGDRSIVGAAGERNSQNAGSSLIPYVPLRSALSQSPPSDYAWNRPPATAATPSPSAASSSQFPTAPPNSVASTPNPQSAPTTPNQPVAQTTPSSFHSVLPDRTQNSELSLKTPPSSERETPSPKPKAIPVAVVRPTVRPPSDDGSSASTPISPIWNPEAEMNSPLSQRSPVVAALDSLHRIRIAERLGAMCIHRCADCRQAATRLATHSASLFPGLLSTARSHSSPATPQRPNPNWPTSQRSATPSPLLLGQRRFPMLPSTSSQRSLLSDRSATPPPNNQSPTPPPSSSQTLSSPSTSTTPSSWTTSTTSRSTTPSSYQRTNPTASTRSTSTATERSSSSETSSEAAVTASSLSTASRSTSDYTWRPNRRSGRARRRRGTAQNQGRAQNPGAQNQSNRSVGRGNNGARSYGARRR